ncbi:MAG: ribosome biogenesis GTP-binding protein YihA/YsxC [Mycoplasma sp.]
MKFIKSATKPSEYIYDAMPEVCFIGRSNVGKSTLINALSNSKVARTSNTPGRTQLINFFQSDKYRLVDLPGYGFAKLSKQQQYEISKMIEIYLNHSKNLVAVFQLCDINVITDLDVEMAEYFQSFRKKIKHFVVLNKIDKQKMYRYQNKVDEVSQAFKVDKENIILVSARDKTNIKELGHMIFNSISK